MCGKIEEPLVRAIIEGVELAVCSKCSKFGKALGPIRRIVKKEVQRHVEPKEEKIQLIAENYSELIKKKRESMGLSQKDFAIKLSEKESTIHHMENHTLEPNLALAKKLEKFLGIKLIEENKEEFDAPKQKKDMGFTLGDFIKVRK